MKTFIGLIWLAASAFILIAQPENANTPIEFLHPKVIDLGKISQGQVAEGKIEFVNKGSAPVEIEAIRPSCGCTAVTPSKMVYAPGETAVIPFSLKTAGFNGVVRKTIKVTFKNIEPNSFTFTAQANVITELNITPNFVNFYQVALQPDTTVTEYFEIENTTEQAVEITKISTDSKFIKISPETVTIPPGKSHLVRVDLVPSEPGRHNTQVNIDSNLQTEGHKSLPVFIYIMPEKQGKGS